MNCPACNKNHTSLLSICPSCGTMINDSVREELEPKISRLPKPLQKKIEESPVQEKISASLKIEMIDEPAKLEPPVEQKESLPTERFIPKTTSPILVEFQNKNAVVPEWRLQLQNAVRRRNSGQPDSPPIVPPKPLITNGATALKAETVEQPVVSASANPTLEKALQRIEKSRQKFLVEEKSKTDSSPLPQRSFPYVVASRPQTFSIPNSQSADKSAIEPTGKANVSFNQPKAEKFDTNKLPPLPAKAIDAFERTIEIPKSETVQVIENNLLEFKADESVDVIGYAETISEEVAQTANAPLEADDRAPMMMRFNAGFFDLIIGAFTSFILLAPFTLTNGNLFTFQGLLAFLATCSIVMFIYLTATIGTMGRTFGMKIFSLEIVDIEENVYPSFHQAAVSSSVYLVSLALGGVGFLTLFLNDENRAAHDLVSGTIVVKEYE